MINEYQFNYFAGIRVEERIRFKNMVDIWFKNRFD